MSDKTYPIAEIFHSPQGEGAMAGYLCCFVRLAGCNVGKSYSAEAKKTLGLEVYQERCTAWDSESFPCDTNYRASKKMTVDEIMKEVGDTPRMLLTGGEPLMHDVVPLIQEAWKRGKKVHIETSGTRPIPCLSSTDGTERWLWVCVSPKEGFTHESLDEADEIRVLVNKDFDEDKFLATFSEYFDKDKVAISAVNDEHTVNMENIQRCLQLQLKYPKLRLSLQTHKWLGVR